MRFSTLFLLFSFSLVAGCGSDNDESSTSSSSPTYPPIIQEPANSVILKEGEFYRPTAFVDDSTNDRWLIADKMQGIIAINKTTDARTVITPLSSDDTGLQSITDIVLDTATHTLYVLDTTAKNIAMINSDTGAINGTLDSDVFDDLADARWGVPTSLFFDDVNQRLLIGDSTGLETENSNGDTVYSFCVFSYTPANDNLSIMAETESRENRRFDIYDIYYDAEKEQLLTSGLYYTNPNTAYYAAQMIPDGDWASASYLFIKTSSSISNSAMHSISYDKANTAVYFVDSDARAIYGFDISAAGPVPTLITYGNDGKAYPFQRPSAINFSADYGLLLLDESNRTLLSVAHVELDQDNSEDGTSEEIDLDRPSALRSLLISGAPLPTDADSFLQFPYDLLIEPTTDALIITDRADAQRNAISYNSDGYTPWAFIFNSEGITPYNVNYDSNEGETPPSAPSITKPKPILLERNKRQDVLVYALSYRTESDDEFVHHRYPAGIYQRLNSEGSNAEFTPISTFSITSDGETKIYMQDFSGIFSPSELRDFAVTQDGIIFHYEKITNAGTRSFMTFWQKNENALITVSSNTTAYTPRNVTGMALSPDESTLYFTDSYHDSLISIELNSLDGTPSFTFNVVSGRQHEGHYMALPAGLALNQALTKAWVFDNAVKAIIEIDLDTGSRTRINSEENYIQSVKSLELSEDETTLFLIEKTLNRVISIDLISEGHPQNWLTPNGEATAN